MGLVLAPDIISNTADRIVGLIYPEKVAKQNRDYSMAKKFIKERKFNEAIEEFKKVLKEDPGDTNIQFEIASVYADHLKDYKNAIVEYDKAIAMNPEDSMWVLIQHRLADIYSQNMDDIHSAMERLEKIIARFPQDHKYTQQAQQRIKFLKKYV